MRRRFFKPRRLWIGAAALLLAGAALLWLNRFDDRMTVRYQAAGRVVDGRGAPVPGVRIALLLAPPPPAGPARDALFEGGAGERKRRDADGAVIGAVGPVVGRSDAAGAFLVRVSGRMDAANALRLGLDPSARPPFRTGWLILRRPGSPDATRTISLLGWRAAPKQWGLFANPLPVVVLAP